MSAVSLRTIRSLALGTLVAGLLVAAPAANAKPIVPVKVKASPSTTTVTVAGDTKSDLPSSATTTFVTIERPQVADESTAALPIVLSGLALLVAAGSAAFAVRRGPAQPSPGH